MLLSKCIFNISKRKMKKNIFFDFTDLKGLFLMNFDCLDVV